VPTILCVALRLAEGTELAPIVDATYAARRWLQRKIPGPYKVSPKQGVHRRSAMWSLPPW